MPKTTRREAMLAALAAPVVARTTLAASSQAALMVPYSDDLLPSGVRSRFVGGINGLRIHVLEAGFEERGRPGVLLLHGFPELAYSWRKIMVPLAEAGYHVFAPDQRGYGRTTGWDANYDGDTSEYRALNLVRDALGLVHAFGHRSVAVVGHDYGSGVAAWCAIVRPDVFISVALMSSPFSGTFPIPFGTREGVVPETPVYTGPGSAAMDEALAKLLRPRKHYQRYYTTREANPNMWRAPQGVHAFLRAYYHHKSADWEGNRPYRLTSTTAAEISKMPTYYIMELEDGMAETVAKHMPSVERVAANRWLPDKDLEVYAREYERTGFQGGLNWYRSFSSGLAELELFSGRTIDQPSIFIAGESDWGSYQSRGALETMQNSACTNMRGIHMVQGAGHWVQQE